MIAPRLVIAGTHSGVGKTTVTLALLAALRKRGRVVQPFKAGPDFIDPGHHSAVTGRPSRNLDGWMLGERINRDIFVRAAAEVDISIIEGMMGLFDGSSSVSEVGSTAELAKQLDAPVLLVIDGSAMARSAAAMVSGYAAFDQVLRVAGVLFNRVSGEGHYRLLKDAVETTTKLTVVGYLKPDPTITIPDRHLGLLTAIEQGSSERYDRLATLAAETIDLDLVETLANAVRALEPSPVAPMKKMRTDVRIGVAYDPAFCFYYQDNLDLLEGAGAHCIRFSPLNDRCLPDVDLLYLGGGYPELYGERLTANCAMREAIRSFVDRGGAIYAECGGMMYLTQAIRDLAGRSHEMVGIFPAEAVMQKSGMTLGYRTVECARSCLFGDVGLVAHGHEFHYSHLVPSEPLEQACVLRDANGNLKGSDGLVRGNALGLYTHVHFASQPKLATALVEAAGRAAVRVSGQERGS